MSTASAVSEDPVGPSRQLGIRDIRLRPVAAFRPDRCGQPVIRVVPALTWMLTTASSAWELRVETDHGRTTLTTLY